jgi:hypothetical protein
MLGDVTDARDGVADGSHHEVVFDQVETFLGPAGRRMARR